MKESQFSVARRYVARRSVFAIDCKTGFPLRSDDAEFVDARLGLLAVPYFPVRTGVRCWAQLLSSSSFCARIVGGGWTNGFCILADPLAGRSTQEIEFPWRDDFLATGAPIRRGCLVYYQKAQDAPVTVLSSERASLLFQTRTLDILFTRIARLSGEILLFLDKGATGVVFTAFDVPVAYMAGLRFPKFVESVILAHAEEFYARCRHRPKPE